MRVVKYSLSFLFILAAHLGFGQITGGENSFQFLTLPTSPMVSALGGYNVSSPEADVSLVAQNPAQMRPGLHNQLSLNYNNYYGDISISNLQYGYHVPKINASFFTSIQYINYGTFSKTDNLGNTYGDFTARDYSISVGASGSYLKHWRYGAAVKWAASRLYESNAAAALLDVGINYYDTESLLDIGLAAKNMGVMVHNYSNATGAEPLPFDVQIGISKKFKHMPLRIFTTIHHLYQWDISYYNPADNTTSVLGTNTNNESEPTFTDKLFRHFIFGGELSLGKHLLVTGSYNVQRRRELAMKAKPGSAGFAFGVAVNLNKFQIHYSRSYYHITGPYNEFGLNLSLNKFVGMGKSDSKMGWSNEYNNW